MRIGLRNVRVWMLALAAAAVAAPASAAPQAAAPASQGPPQVDRYVVGQARPPEVPGATLLELTLEEAVLIALEKNLDLKVARMEPQIQDYTLRAARASFRPTVTGTYSYNNSSQISTSTLDGVNRLVNQNQSYNSGLSQTMPWYGGSMSVNFTNSRATTNNVTANRNPSYRSSVRFGYTQPLLTNLRIDNTRNQIRTLQVQRQITDITLLAQVENTRASVRSAYWALRSAIEQIEIQQRSLDLARRQLEDNRIRVELGAMAPIETTTSEVQVANQEQALLNAQIQWRTAELNFKRLLVSGADDALYLRTINPVDRPTFEVQAVDIAGAVQTALAQRTDVEQQRKNLQVSEMNLELSRNATLPRLDLTGNYTLEGTGGTQFLRDGTIIPSGYLDALRGIGTFDTPAWSLSFNFNYPLGMAAAKANLARAELQIEQSRARLKAQELTIATQVTNAGLAVENTYKQLQAAIKAREVADRNAEAEQTRFDVGMSNNYNVAQALNNLTSARLSELRAVINYVNAVAEFERLQRVGG